MKKFVLLIMVVISGHQLSFSQVTKGNFLLGGSISYQSTKFSDGGDNTNIFNVMPDVGYFFADRFAGGLRAAFTNYSNDGDSYRDLLIGPFARYYFLPAANKTNIFLDGSFMFGSEKDEGFDAISKTQFAFAAGPAFFINPHVAVEATVGWRSLKYEDDEGRYNTFGIAVGFQIHLDCMKGNKKK